MTTATAVKVGRTPTGFWLRLEGRGTLRESPVVAAFADQVLAGPSADLVFDLTTCDYFDSTFLGCLVGLNRRYGEPQRFRIRLAPEAVERILSPTHLDRLLPLTDAPPDHLGDELVLSGIELTPLELGRHVLECHRRLVELGGAHEKTFAPIVQRLEQELDRHS